MGQYVDNKLQQFLGSEGVYAISRPSHILIDVNGKEHSDLGINHFSNTLSNTFFSQSHFGVTVPKKLLVRFMFCQFIGIDL